MSPIPLWYEPRRVDYRELYLRVLGVIYLIAFASWGWQVRALVGERGVLPSGIADAWLVAAGVVGALAAGLMVAKRLGRWPRAVAWATYLFLVYTGGIFQGYQWESLLLEAGFLAIFLTPDAPWMGWLHRWLLFRLLLSSGVAKLLSGDPTWRDLTALQYHFETQPLPTWIGWYAHQFSAMTLKVLTALVLVIEIPLTVFFFLSGRFRWFAFYAVAFLQIGILLTGNYGYFNILTLALCLFLLEEKPMPLLRPPPAVVVMTLLGGFQLLALLQLAPRWMYSVLDVEQRLRLVNSYGLFAVMTTERNELVIEGSADGTTWKAYALPFKPQDLMIAPGFVAPYQPRLDWQAWFAALSPFQRQAWLHGTLFRLLEGEPRVRALFRTDPFPEAPPKFLRVQSYRFHFTTRAERAATGAWWRREGPVDYGPARVSREDFTH